MRFCLEQYQVERGWLASHSNDFLHTTLKLINNMKFAYIEPREMEWTDP